VGIVGPGRAGVGLALALRRAGVRIAGIHGRRRRALPRGLRLSVGGSPPWLDAVDAVLLAVRDDALSPLVTELAGRRWRRGQIVLHLSGALPSGVLTPLRRRGAAVGSLHPLMTVGADPRRAAAAFRGATFAVEGDPAAVRVARALARSLGGFPVAVRAGARARYHAGAVFASNYVVTLFGIAEELLAAAGFSRAEARRALGPLAGASVANAAALGPAAALTGPVARGDAATVARHLAALPARLRPLYRAAGAAALSLARTAGLPSAAGRQMEAALRDGGGPRPRGRR
jgi:predicted short-subunit dehydrogenase-like oxidoreductase (DUF2520 family)